MRQIIVLIFSIAVAFTSRATDLKSFTAEADQFFKKYVADGSVSYKQIKLNFHEVEILYGKIGSANLTGRSEQEKKAFYINAYNVIVIYWVVKHYPLKSPMDNSGFFDKVRHNVAGEQITLNALEIKKLLQPYKDARFHFVLACAAKSCPPLANFAYTPENVDQQLTTRTRLALNDKAWLKIYPSQKKAELSKIFDWYKGDFGGDEKALISWINLYRSEKIPATYTVGFYDYNWNLNE